MKLWINSISFDVTSDIDQTLHLAIPRAKKWSKMGESISYFTDLKKSYNSVSKEILYIILTKFSTLIKPDGPITIHSNESRSKSL